MSLEVGDGFISGLVASNPVGATDPKSQGDDHIRLIKAALLGTFPNLDDAVEFTPTEANFVVGVTSAIQTQLDGKALSAHDHSAADLTSGTIPDARFPATLPALSGANLTALNASNLASGTIPDARFPATLPALSGANLTSLDATDLTGTINDARLSSQVCLKDTAITSVDDGSASDPGYRGMPAVTKTDDYTFALGDAGKLFLMNGASKTFTIPANASVAFPEGTVITIVAIQTCTIAITTDTLFLLGTGFATTGSRTLAAGGIATLIKTGSGGWCISGVSLT